MNTFIQVFPPHTSGLAGTDWAGDLHTAPGTEFDMKHTHTLTPKNPHFLRLHKHPLLMLTS